MNVQHMTAGVLENTRFTQLNPNDTQNDEGNCFIMLLMIEQHITVNIKCLSHQDYAWKLNGRNIKI